MAILMWIAIEIDDVTVLFNSEDEESLSWLDKTHGVGETREEAIQNLKRRLSDGKKSNAE